MIGAPVLALALAASAVADDNCLKPLPTCHPSLSAAGGHSFTGPSFAGIQGACEFRDRMGSFLTGCRPSCAATGCPDRRGLQVPAASRIIDLHSALGSDVDHTPYYRDHGIGGHDHDPARGLESANVVFNIGHGFAVPPGYGPGGQCPQAVGEDDCLEVVRDDNERFPLSQLRLGDGAIRYLLLDSCYVMSHGPEGCAAAIPFGCPQEYVPGTYVPGTPDYQRNVFARWKDRMAPGLRMACGGSTELSRDDISGQFWEFHLVDRLPVADSVILATASSFYTPLCITHGVKSPPFTPLFDRSFTDQRNRKVCEYGHDHDCGPGPFLHAIYPVHESTTTALESTLVAKLALQPQAPGSPPTKLRDPPVLGVTPTTPMVLPVFQKLPFGFIRIPFQLLAKGVAVHFHPRSGAVVVRWNSNLPGGLTTVLSLPIVHGLLKSLLEQTQMWNKAEVSSLTLTLDRVESDDAASEPPCCFQTCRYTRIRPWLTAKDADGTAAGDFPLLGASAEWLFGSCPAGNGDPCVHHSPAATCPAAGRGEMVLAFKLRGISLPEAVAGAPSPPFHREDESSPEDREERLRAKLIELGMTEGTGKGMWKRLPGRDRVGYLTAPSHCRQHYLYPVLQATYEEAVPIHGDRPHRREVQVPYYKMTDEELESDWRCNAETG